MLRQSTTLAARSPALSRQELRAQDGESGAEGALLPRPSERQGFCCQLHRAFLGRMCTAGGARPPASRLRLRLRHSRCLL